LAPHSGTCGTWRDTMMHVVSHHLFHHLHQHCRQRCPRRTWIWMSRRWVCPGSEAIWPFLPDQVSSSLAARLQRSAGLSACRQGSAPVRASWRDCCVRPRITMGGMLCVMRFWPNVIGRKPAGHRRTPCGLSGGRIAFQARALSCCACGMRRAPSPARSDVFYVCGPYSSSRGISSASRPSRFRTCTRARQGLRWNASGPMISHNPAACRTSITF